ncbi:hypothetical protein PHET_10278 [Paragonimus heterotremus]|uniref:Uncharacterized protein n=1 Tax=Paragonimus heterotremus TaxID=100268 RepID=A0A8J4T8T9_9TREM|nr:hypothetical protein PHET_10278 [Paragonimus heterotremus]
MVWGEAINAWLTGQLSSWSADPTGVLSVTATFLTTYALYRIYIHWFHTQYLQPSEYLNNQSVVVDPKVSWEENISSRRHALLSASRTK